MLGHDTDAAAAAAAAAAAEAVLKFGSIFVSEFVAMLVKSGHD